MRTPAPPPATRLHDARVENEQTGSAWLAGEASIDGGCIVISGNHAPAELLERAASTYTITAMDGAGRARRFAGVTLDREASSAGDRYVFR